MMLFLCLPLLVLPIDVVSHLTIIVPKALFAISWCNATGFRDVMNESHGRRCTLEPCFFI